MSLDVVYLVKQSERNEELRYSLRSLVNLPHRRVYVVGYQPGWVQGVEFIPGNRHRAPWLNVYDNLRIACEQVPSRQFVVMNDDFFVMGPVTRLPSWHRYSLAEHVRVSRGWWKRSLKVTQTVLANAGIGEPLSYELHVPVVMQRAKLAQALAMWEPTRRDPMPPQWRTLYGNLWQVPSERAPDCKIRTTRQHWSDAGPFLSTEDFTFRVAEPVLARRFNERSPYERPSTTSVVVSGIRGYGETVRDAVADVLRQLDETRVAA